ncbi:hypothetical protein [Sulfurimonas sp.]|uniref:hypothetical protein n=1 Tax=Sulfurimonas sp. TaxID=2022749 RepID=UPI002B4A4B69|nr:hypothetical protein [Sulfurimonas sp.]
MILTLNDFDILRFKLSKLLKLKEKRVTDIHIYCDNKVGVQTFPFGLVKFDSLKEIEDDYNKFYSDEEIPKRLKLVCDENDACKPSVKNTKD